MNHLAFLMAFRTGVSVMLTMACNLPHTLAGSGVFLGFRHSNQFSALPKRELALPCVPLILIVRNYLIHRANHVFHILRRHGVKHWQTD